MKKIFSILITTVLAFVAFASPVNAYYEAEKHIVDPGRIQDFISVEDGQFIIDLPKGYYIDESIKREIYLQLENTNKVLAADNLEFDIAEGKAVGYYSNPSEVISTTYGFGVNKVEVYWNYARVFLNRDVVRWAVGLTVAVVLGALNTNIVGYFANAVLGGIAFIAPQLVDGINHGYRFDANFYYTLAAYFIHPVFGAMMFSNIQRQ